MKRIVSSALLIVFLISAFFMTGTVYSDRSKDEVKNEISQKQDEIKKSEEAIKNLEASQGNEIEKRNAYEKLIKEQTELIELCEEEIEILNNELAQLEKDLEKEIKDYDDAFEIFLLRIRDSYEDGGISNLDILFNSETITDYAIKVDAIKQIAEFDNEILKGLEQSISTINELKASVETKKLSQEDIRISHEATKKKYENNLKSSNALLERIEDDIRDNEQLKKELMAELEELNKELDRIIDAETGKDSDYDQGKMLFPLESYRRVSSRFMEEDPEYYYEFGMWHNGYDFSARTGTEIYAAADGVVIASAYQERGGGHYVNIDHGGEVVTQYLHMDSRAVKKGDIVKRGDLIGYVGSTGWSTGPHLHFGVRVEGEWVNPTLYINIPKATQ